MHTCCTIYMQENHAGPHKQCKLCDTNIQRERRKGGRERATDEETGNYNEKYKTDNSEQVFY